MLALQQQQQQRKLKSKSLHGRYGSQTVARSRNIASSHNPSRLLTNNTFLQQYDPKLLIPVQAESRNYIYNYQQQQHQMKQQQQQKYHHPTHESLISAIEKQAMLNRPLCRCRVMYLGSSVPHVTKNGLHGIQEPLRHLYPEEKFNANKLMQQQQIIAAGNHTLPNNTTIDISHLSSSLGIDSWLSVWSNGLLLENVDEFGREIKRFFFIESLHYCAAVRFFDTTTLMSDQRNTTRISGSTVNYHNNDNNNGSENGDLNNNNTIQRNKNFQNSSTNSNNNNNNKQQQQQAELELTSTTIQDGEPADEMARQQKQRKNAIRFLPLDAPLFQCPGMLDANHPPMFASIMRRTTGIKVLECHAFICRRDAAANALVRCCTHAYSDFLNAKRLSIELGQTMACNEYSKGATINGFSSVNRRKRATSVASRMVKTSNRNSSPTYEIANNFTDSSKNSSDTNNHLGSSTCASNEDNSIEVPSEDNYAIISKYHHQNQQQPPINYQEQNFKSEDKKGRKRNKNRSESERHDSKCASTRSLYYDFTPETRDNDLPDQPDCCAGEGESRDGEKILSHSLDLLNKDFDESCCINSSDSNDMPIKYSIVKNKRHSKSMQNLDGPFEFNALAARSSSRLRKGRRNRCSTAKEIEKSRKAASYQDMIRNISSSSDMIPQEEQQQQSSPGSHTKPVCYIDSNTVLDCDCPEARSMQKVSLIQPETICSNSIRGRKPSSKRTQSQQSLPRIRKPRDIQNQFQYTEQQQLHNQIHLNGGQMIYQQPHHLPVYPQASPPINLAYSPMYLPSGGGGGPAACYLSPANQVANHYHQPMYATPSGGSIYEQLSHGNPYLAQSPPISAPLAPHMNHHAAYMHPSQFLHHHHHHNAGLPPQPPHLAAGIYNGGDICSQTMMLPSKKKAKSSLARFRCLSPPLNFITHINQSVVANGGGGGGGSNRNSHQLTPPPTTTPATQLSEQSTTTTRPATLDSNKIGEFVGSTCLPSVGVSNDDQICCNKQVAVNNANGEHINGCFEGDDNENITIVQESNVENLNVDGVVSAKPSFISSATNIREKKMSWIKRLSLTMISGSATPTNDTGEQQVNKLSIDPNGNQEISAKDNDSWNKQQNNSEQNGTETGKKTKRKSRLFSGSLTLGRKKQQQHAKLQITQQPPAVLATTTVPNTYSTS